MSLYGTWRLARLDARAVALFDTSPAGARQSFLAAVLVAPVFAFVTILLPPEGASAGGLRWIPVQAIAYVLSWVAYPVVVEWLSRRMNCRDRFEGYLSVYNWSMVLQNTALLPLAVLTAADIAPPDVLQLFWFVAIAVIMGYLWFIARTTLGVSGMTAAGLVLLDELLSALIDGIASRLS